MKFRRSKMGCLVLGMAVVCGVHLPDHSVAAEFAFTSETMVAGYERDTSVERQLLVLPIYEFMQLDLGALNEAGLSLHANGWGRSDVGDGGFFTDDQTSELVYGYVEYTATSNNLSARLGRQYIFDGPASESVDGIRIQGEFADFDLSGFAGLPVALDEDNGSSGDEAYGASLAYKFFGYNDVGLSYKRLTSDSDLAEESVGLDAFVAVPEVVDLTISSTRNLITDDWAEHYVEAGFAVDVVTIKPYFQMFQYDDYFSDDDNSADPFRYLAGTDEELTILAADLVNSAAQSWEYGAKVKHYDYRNLDENSLYLSALATWHGNDLTQVGAEIGSMTGDQPENEYLLYRFYSYLEHESVGIELNFISFDLVYVDYSEEIQNESRSLFASLGGGWHLVKDTLDLEISGDYSSDPFFDKDLRGMMVLTYKFSSEEE